MWPTKVTYISFATVPIATKLAKVVAYLVVYLLIWIIWEIENISPLPECLWPIQLGGWWHAMPRSGCSALHGVNPNFKKKYHMELWPIKSYVPSVTFHGRSRNMEYVISLIPLDHWTWNMAKWWLLWGAFTHNVT